MKPTTGMLGCCARAASGHAAAPPISVMNLRRLIAYLASVCFWHQFDLPKCQVHRGYTAKYLNGHFGGLFVYFLHFAPKTS